MNYESTNQPQSEQPTELYTELKEMMWEQPASVGQRFLNYLVDIILFYFMFYAIGLLLGIFALVFGINIGEFSSSYSNSGLFQLLDLLITVVLLVLYFTFFEGVTKGRTVGKMLTKTKVVKTDGSEITPRDAFKRSLCRLVPFEPFSAFSGNPWHDQWTDTKVIKDVR